MRCQSKPLHKDVTLKLVEVKGFLSTSVFPKMVTSDIKFNDVLSQSILMHVSFHLGDSCMMAQRVKQ